MNRKGIEFWPDIADWRHWSVLILLMPVLVFAVSAAVFDVDLGVLLAAWLATLREEPAELGELLLLLATGLVMLLSARRFSRHGRLVIGNGVIKLSTGMPRSVRWLAPTWVDWEIAINDIQDAELRPDANRRGCILLLRLADGKRCQLTPTQWAPARQAAGVRLDAQDPESLLRQSILLRELSNAGVEIRPERKRYRGEHLDKQFDLFSSPATVWVLVIFGGCIAYALLDSVALLEQAYAQTPPYTLFAISAVVGGAICALALTRSATPKLEAIGVSVLFALAVGAAMWPGTLRVNAYFASTPPEMHHYVLKAGPTLWPKTKDAPKLHAPIDAPFWRAQDIGSQWDIELQRGGLGIWQYNKAQLLPTIRAYYRRPQSQGPEKSAETPGAD